MPITDLFRRHSGGLKVEFNGHELRTPAARDTHTLATWHRTEVTQGRHASPLRGFRFEAIASMVESSYVGGHRS